MKKTSLLFLLLTLCFSHSLEAKRRGTSISRLQLRVGEAKKVGGYNNITASPSKKVHISKYSEDTYEITGMEEGMVILKFYQDGDEAHEKAVHVRPARQDSDANISFGFGVGYPGYYYSSDPLYDPLYGWWGYPRHGYYRHRWHHHW